MDFAGQKLSEQLILYVVVLGALFGFIVGYALESYRTMMLVYAGGVLLAFVVAVPDWGYFNQNPVKWLPSLKKAREEKAKHAADTQKKANARTKA